MENEKLQFSRADMAGLKVIPSYIITSYLAGDYFQVLRNIIAPAAPIVRQLSSFIIMPEWSIVP